MSHRAQHPEPARDVTNTQPLTVGRPPRRWLSRGLMCLGGVVLVAGALLVIGVGVNRAAPYAPFVIRSYVVTPQTVCVGAPVTATITRRFTRQVDSFQISESWETAATGFQASGKPIGQGGAGQLPPKLLTPSDDFKTAQSPVIHNAPTVPGTYRVRVDTHSVGRRFGLSTSGSGEFLSDDSVTVLPRTDRRCQ